MEALLQLAYFFVLLQDQVIPNNLIGLFIHQFGLKLLHLLNHLFITLLEPRGLSKICSHLLGD